MRNAMMDDTTNAASRARARGEHADRPFPVGRPGERGSVLFISLVLVMVLVGMTMSTLLVVKGAGDQATASQEHMRALYAAEFGVQQAVISLSSGGDGNVASAQNPLEVENACELWVETTDNGDNTYTVVARGRVGRVTRAIQANVMEQGHVFDHAVFAGNAGADPTYVMKFGGHSGQADKVEGDVYSGGSVEFDGDSDIDGHVRAAGAVTGVTSYTTGVTQPIPDITGMNYPVNNDVDVAAEFAAEGQWKSDDAGGTAMQLPETNAAHIFRMNPSDRHSENASTVKDDYYLEDPYEAVRVDSRSDGTDPYMITVPGYDDTAHPKEIVYFVDGNLWVHNRHTMSLMFKSAGAGVRITIIARGDIIISDNLFYDNDDDDGLALIAIKDPAVPNTGNIYFGDPTFGTLETLHGFLYAENNFYDINLSASGSKKVIVKGTMSAGNLVDIQRDYHGQHSQLKVSFDPRLRDGTIEIPGIPESEADLTYKIAAWRAMSE